MICMVNDCNTFIFVLKRFMHEQCKIGAICKVAAINKTTVSSNNQLRISNKVSKYGFYG